MGLRINTNITALSALRNLKLNDLNQSRSLERLSTGLRINRGSDDPSGLVISEKLRAQLSALNQAVDNAQNASNLISVADSGLQQISDLLVQIQSSVEFALNTGGSSPEQVAAEQAAVDQAISAIDRIARTTRYSDRELLNGSAAYTNTVTSTGPINDVLNDLEIESMVFPQGVDSRTIEMVVERVAQRAEIRVSGLNADDNGVIGGVNPTVVEIVAVGDTELEITGSRGTVEIFLSDGTFTTGIESAVNAVADQTGVYASGVVGAAGAATSIVFFSEDYGSDQDISIRVVSGALAPMTSGLPPVATGTIDTNTAGADNISFAELAMAGVYADGFFNGATVRIVDPDFNGGEEQVRTIVGYTGATGEITLNAALGAALDYLGAETFTIDYYPIATDVLNFASSSTRDVDGGGGLTDAGFIAEGTFAGLQWTSTDGADGSLSAVGLDARLRIQGDSIDGDGLSFDVRLANTSFNFALDPDVILAGINDATSVFNLQDNANLAPGGAGITIDIEVERSGLVFQVNEKAQSTDQIAIAIPDVTISKLGTDAIRDRVNEALVNLDLDDTPTEITAGGFLNSLKSGGDNDLETNPDNALEVIEAAIDQVTELRGQLGAIQAFNIEPGINAVQVEIQNLSASLSSIRDLDFAEETSAFTRTQILFQSGIAVLASANLIPQSILTLLR
ncbi:hypothetical protein HY605_05410 [Candidatus Peregrinibacteria bacterium]|nr:hypothetical protein [Candidatus Peregrinibacteria bacterium]